MANKSKKTRSKSRQKRNTTNGGESGFQTFLRNEILAFLKRNAKDSFTAKKIARETGLWEQVKINKLRSVLDELTQKGEIKYLDKGHYQYSGTADSVIEGTIQVVRAGFGFLLMKDAEDIYISHSNLNKALDGDRVQVKILSTRRKRGGKLVGKVEKVIERNREEFVGTIEKVGKTYLLVPDDARINIEFFVAKGKTMGAKPGQKVLTRLIGWERRSPEVEVIRVLGKAGENEVEMHAILYQYGFDPKFPDEVEAEAKEIATDLPQDEISRRLDLRAVPTFTIDPVDAKDFDDALSLRKIRDGRWEVGVHIADVSYYVKPGTKIDQEGFRRATSVYLVDRTVPMLPEKLSNQVCSLRPEEDKFTFSAIFELDKQGKVHKRWFGRTVTHSDYRFHYGEAEAVLKGEADGPFSAELTVLNQIAYRLREDRFSKGSIDFDTPEIKFVLDEKGRPIGVRKKERGDSNRLIEDFMLLANREVAAYVAKLAENPPLAFPYRIHDQPDPEKLARLGALARALGHEARFDEKGDTAQVMNRLIRAAEDKPEQNVIESVAIRSMAKAVYTTHNIGHYGLGFAHYTHFTSPIRRYPDLIVHRRLQRYLDKEFSSQDPTALEQKLEHCSKRERTASEAERASIKYKQVEFLKDKVGEQFDGVVSGLIEGGLFVELKENLAEGFVPVHSLEHDFFDFDADLYHFIGRSTGRSIRLGDEVKVEIAGTDLVKRQIDMVLVDEEK